MVAIKQEMNFGEDIEMIGARKELISGKLETETDPDTIAALNAETAELDADEEAAIEG
jgi:hypothetical protein